MSVEAYVQQQIKEIVAWEGEEPWFITKAFSKLTSPLAWGIRLIIPNIAVKGAVSMADWIASLTTRETWILKENDLNTIQEVRSLPLEKQDAMADSVHNWAIALATAEGGVAGAAGLPGMAVDIPAVIGLAFRTIRQVGLCYGYPMESDEDFQLALNILSLTGAGSMKEKTASLATLRSLQPTLKTSWKAMEKIAENNPATREAFLLALKRVAEQLGYRLTKEKALQAIPLIGAGVGSASNLAFIRSVGWAARRTFQRRTLEAKGLTIVAQT